MTDPAVFTIAEVAGILRCSPSTVRRAVDRGEIPCVRVLGVVRIPASFVSSVLTLAHDSPPAIASRHVSPGIPPAGVDACGSRSGVDGSTGSGRPSTPADF